MASNPSSNSSVPAIPEPFTTRDVVLFSVIGLVIFWVLFGFMFSLSTM